MKTDLKPIVDLMDDSIDKLENMKSKDSNIYKTKPIFINAWKWDETQTMFDRIGCKMMSCKGHTERPNEMSCLYIEIQGKAIRVNKGDFIIKNEYGSYGVCNSRSFELIYEIVKPQKESDFN